MSQYRYEEICMEECSRKYKVWCEEYFNCVQNCIDALLGRVPVRVE